MTDNTQQIDETENSSTDDSDKYLDKLRLLENVDVQITVQVGSRSLPIRDIVKIREGSVVSLDRQATDYLDIYANGALIARGEIVLVGDNFGVRFVEIVIPSSRL